jgi:small subunit ribosomal protein S17
MTSEQPKTGRRTLIGTVVSDKMEKTVVVEVTRRVLHGRYHKYMTRRKKYKAHDETNAIQTGAEVVIEESRPLSRTKRWVVIEERTKGTGEVLALAGDEDIRQPETTP